MASAIRMQHESCHLAHSENVGPLTPNDSGLPEVAGAIMGVVTIMVWYGRDMVGIGLGGKQDISSMGQAKSTRIGWVLSRMAVLMKEVPIGVPVCRREGAILCKGHGSQVTD